jgi:hypothetical protein
VRMQRRASGAAAHRRACTGWPGGAPSPCTPCRAPARSAARSEHQRRFALRCARAATCPRCRPRAPAAAAPRLVLHVRAALAVARHVTLKFALMSAGQAPVARTGTASSAELRAAWPRACKARRCTRCGRLRCACAGAATGCERGAMRRACLVLRPSAAASAQSSSSSRAATRLRRIACRRRVAGVVGTNE